MPEDWTPPHTDCAPPKPGEPSLFRAAREGDHDAIRRLIASGEDPNAVFDIGRDPDSRDTPATPLMVAAGSGDGATLETVALLLELGADPKVELDGHSAAHFAAIGLGWNYRPGGDAARLERLLIASSPIPREGPLAAFLVARTAEVGDPERLGVLLDRGLPAGPSWDLQAGRERAAGMACDFGEFELPEELEIPEEMADDFQELFSAVSEDVMSMARSGLERGPYPHEIPLFKAAESGSARCVELLLAAGADPDQRDCSDHTALFYAASAEVVGSLAAAGIDLDHRDQFGRDAFRTVLERYNDDPTTRQRGVVEGLLRAGVALERSDQFGHSRLYGAAFKEAADAVELLLDLGHAVEPEPSGVTALHAICWQSDHDDERDEATRRIVRTLITAGFSPHHADPDGDTLLHEAVAGDGANLVAAEVLFEHGADPNVQNNDGETPLHYLYNHHFEYAKVVPFMLRHGANPLVRDGAGQSVLDLARARAAGDGPEWWVEQSKDEGETPCGWKAPAIEGDEETAVIRQLEQAAARFGG